MASSPLPLLFFTLSLLSVSAFARPCKTFFFFTTIPTTTTTPQEPIFSSFNFVPFQTYPSNSPKFFTFFFNPINNPQDLPNQPSIFPSNSNPTDYFSLRKYPFPRFIINEEEERSESRDRSFMPMGLYRPKNSIGNRMKDIMSVVGALLFGVGCGALTAATMYFVWSLFSPDRFELEDESDSDDGFDGGDDDDFSSKKKVGYVVIPDDDIDAIKKAAQANFKAEAADV